jgi:hypothetical protein
LIHTRDWIYQDHLFAAQLFTGLSFWGLKILQPASLPMYSAEQIWEAG